MDPWQQYYCNAKNVNIIEKSDKGCLINRLVWFNSKYPRRPTGWRYKR